MLLDCVAIYAFIKVLGGLETRSFETETRQDFGIAKPKFFSVNIEEVDEKCMWVITIQTRDFGVPIPRQDTGLYITCRQRGRMSAAWSNGYSAGLVTNTIFVFF